MPSAIELTAMDLAKLLDMPVAKIEAALANLERRNLVRSRIIETTSVNRVAERGMRWLDEAPGSAAISPQVPVFDRLGTRMGQVSLTTTSVGASKIAGGPVEYSRRFGVWGWVAKQRQCEWIKHTACSANCRGPAYCPHRDMIG